MLTSILYCAVVLSAGAPDTDGGTKPLDAAVERAAREFRIQVYNTFRLRREEFNRRRAAGDELLDAWRAVAGAGGRDAVIDWFAEATRASRRENVTRLPAVPVLPETGLATSEPPRASDDDHVPPPEPPVELTVDSLAAPPMPETEDTTLPELPKLDLENLETEYPVAVEAPDATPEDPADAPPLDEAIGGETGEAIDADLEPEEVEDLLRDSSVLDNFGEALLRDANEAIREFSPAENPAPQLDGEPAEETVPAI